MAAFDNLRAPDGNVVNMATFQFQCCNNDLRRIRVCSMKYAHAFVMICFAFTCWSIQQHLIRSFLFIYKYRSCLLSLYWGNRVPRLQDNLSPFDSNIACLCQSIEINNNKHVYRQSKVRKPTGSEVEWAECLLIIGTGCRVQVFSLILDSSVGLSAGIQSAGE